MFQQERPMWHTIHYNEMPGDIKDSSSVEDGARGTQITVVTDDSGRYATWIQGWFKVELDGNLIKDDDCIQYSKRQVFWLFTGTTWQLVLACILQWHGPVKNGSLLPFSSPSFLFLCNFVQLWNLSDKEKQRIKLWIQILCHRLLYYCTRSLNFGCSMQRNPVKFAVYWAVWVHLFPLCIGYSCCVDD